MAQAIEVPTTLNGNDLVDTKYKMQKGTGVKFATVSNWRNMLMQPKDGAIVTTVTTTNGFSYEVYADSQVEAYDPEAQARKKEALKNLKAEKVEVENLFYDKKIDEKEYLKRLTTVSTQIRDLQ